VGKADTTYYWDKAFFEKKVSLLTNCQLGFVGAALMLMMMDLSRIYLLAPLVVGLILASWYKQNIEKVKSQVEHMSVEIAPKSILLKQPNQSLEQRITFREIEEITEHKENLIVVTTLYLKGEQDKVEIKALKDAEIFSRDLNAKMAEQSQQS